MYNNDADFIFPSWVIKELEHQKSDEWQKLVLNVLTHEQDSEVHLGFVFLMAKLNNCNTCNADSFRALKGCKECSLQTLRRLDYSEKKILNEYDKAKNQIQNFIDKEQEMRKK